MNITNIPILFIYLFLLIVDWAVCWFLGDVFSVHWYLTFLFSGLIFNYWLDEAVYILLMGANIT